MTDTIIDHLTAFIRASCLLGKDSSGNRYCVGGSYLSRAFKAYVKDRSNIKVTSQLFYRVIQDLPLGIVVMNRPGGYVVKGITLTSDINSVVERKRHNSEQERIDARRESQRNYQRSVREEARLRTDGTIIDDINTAPINIPQQDPVFTSNPFVWDGSNLGTIKTSNIRSIGTSLKGTKYWYITLGTFGTAASIKRSKDSTESIVDEIKSLFGLPKIGTHRCKLEDSHAYIITKVHVDVDNKIIEELPYGTAILPRVDEYWTS